MERNTQWVNAPKKIESKGLLDPDTVDVYTLLVGLTKKVIRLSGPIVAATRPLKFDKKKKVWTEGEITGSVTNYDGRVTRFTGKKEMDEAVANEKARWHYYKSFEPYGFEPEEWK